MTNTSKCMCIAHYVAKVVVEEEKKGGNPDPTGCTCKVHTNTHKMIWVPSLENWDGGLTIFYGQRQPAEQEVNL